MRRLLPLVLLPMILTLDGCSFFKRRMQNDYCYPSIVPEGPWQRALHGGPWDRACEGVVDNEEMTRVVLTYARELEKKYKLKLYDSRFYYNDTIYKLRLDLTSMQIVELCDARTLLVDVVEGYLSRINENSILRGEISHRPFSAMNMEIHVTFESFYVVFDDPMYIQWIILEDGTSYFYNAELGERTSDYWNKRIEPYSKTLQIVNIERELGPVNPEEKNNYNKLEEKLYETSANQIVP